MKNKIISVLILITMLVVTFMPRPVMADNFVYIDGYKFEILEDNDRQAKLLTVLDNGDKLYGTYNKIDGSISMKVVEYTTHFLGIGLGPKQTTEYNVKVDELNYENIEATVVNTKTNETMEVNEEVDVVQSQAALLLPAIGTAAVYALLRAFLLLIASIVIGTLTYYAADQVIERLRRDQPSVKYYKAVLRNGNVWVGAALTSDSAAESYLRASTGNNVFSYNPTYAKKICAKISPIGLSTTIAEKHDGQGKYYWHYHARTSRTRTQDHLPQHCWF